MNSFLSTPRRAQKYNGGAGHINIAIIILAAGLSERMGVLKPLLPVGAQSAVMRIIRTAESAGVNRIVTVTGHMHSELETELRAKAPGVILVHNGNYREGMFSSARVGISALPPDADGFFLLPSDCCAVSPDTLKKLMGIFSENGGELVIRPKFGGKRGHPPLIPRRYAEGLLSYSGENGIKGFLSALPTAEAGMEDAETLYDMDTPEDYAILLDYLRLPGYPARERCCELFAEHGTPPHIISHGEQVFALAREMAMKLEASGGARIDLRLLESACLLHDIMREEPCHAEAGKKLLLREGYPKAAILVGTHMDLPREEISEIGERELLYLADKLSRGGKTVPLEETERGLKEKYARSPGALTAAAERMETARLILNMIENRV